MYKYTAQFKINKSSDFPSTLIKKLCSVPDGRLNQGKRHSLGLILSLVLLGLLKGKTSTESFSEFGKYRFAWFKKWFGKLEHGMPCARTIDRTLAKTNPKNLVKVVNMFFNQHFSKIEKVMSLDGKTIKAIHGCRKKLTTHMLSLFSSLGRIVDQEGVESKENEITATPRLISRNVLLGSTITTDALLTQKKIVRAIINNHGNYLLPVKGNHPELQDIIKPTFTDPLSVKQIASFTNKRKTRNITTIITLTKSFDIQALRDDGWVGISQVGKLERRGWRVHKGNKTKMNETIYLIASDPDLTSKQAFQINREHWGVENKLHWQKDYTFHEDRQRSRTKHAPEVFSYLRSVAVSLLRLTVNSITKAINQFNEQPQVYKKMLTNLNIV